MSTDNQSHPDYAKKLSKEVKEELTTMYLEVRRLENDGCNKEEIDREIEWQSIRVKKALARVKAFGFKLADLSVKFHKVPVIFDQKTSNFNLQEVEQYDVNWKALLAKQVPNSYVISLKSSAQNETNLAALKAEIQKHFGNKGSYKDRIFPIRHDNRNDLLKEVDTLVQSGKSFDEILKNLKSIGDRAQHHHETVSGWKNPFTGELINKVCGFQDAVNKITAAIDDESKKSNENTPLLKANTWGEPVVFGQDKNSQRPHLAGISFKKM